MYVMIYVINNSVFKIELNSYRISFISFAHEYIKKLT